MRNTILFIMFEIMCILGHSSISAQALFNKRYGSQFKDAGEVITTTKDGGFAVAGITYANGAGGDIFVMKLNQQGSIEWQKDIFGVNLDQVCGINELANGNYIIGGNTYSYGSGNWDAFNVLLDSSGNKIWSKCYGDVNGNQTYGFSLSQGSGFMSCGTSDNTGNNGWLLKTDQNGLLEWSKSYQLTKGFFAVKPTIDGGYLAVGTNSSISILKVDSIGNPVWYQKYLSLPGNTYCYDVETLEDGSAVLTGQIYLNAGGAIADVFLMKIDQNGNLIWFKTFGYTFEEYGYSVKHTPDNGFIIAGWTNSFGHGQSDALLLKTNITGDLLWAKVYGTIWDDRAMQVQAMNDSGFVFVGYSYSAFNVDSSYCYVVRTDKNGNSCDYLDWFPIQQSQNYPPTSQVITATNFGVDSTCNATCFNFSFVENNPCTVNSVQEITNDQVKIYPIPTSSTLTVDGLLINSTIKIFKLTGEIIIAKEIDNGVTIDLSSISQGIYIYEVRNKDGLCKKGKVIKE